MTMKKINNTQLSPALSVSERNFVTGTYEQSTRTYKERDLASELNVIVTKTLQDCGQQMSASDKTNLCSSLAKDLQIKCPNISIWDLHIAFRNGRLNEYGEWFGINTNTLTGWAMAYMKSVDRIKAIEKQRQFEESLKSDSERVDDLRKLELNKQAADFFYSEWRKNPNMTGIQLDCFKGFCIAHHDRLQLPFNQELFDRAIDTVIDSVGTRKLSREEFLRHKEVMAEINVDPMKCKEVVSEYKYLYIKAKILNK